jgi:calcineurin-like phosphoesterase family protein
MTILKNLYLDGLANSSIAKDDVYYIRSKDVKKFRNLEEKPGNINPDDYRVFVWSDTHFFHENIINFCNRPFLNSMEMNLFLLGNYKDIVGENDLCIWVGDVGLGPSYSTETMNFILDQMPGKKILVIGNHDLGKYEHLNFDEKYVLYKYLNIVFTHYPYTNIPPGYINLHGHLHSNPARDLGLPHLKNVNCELQGYKPYPLAHYIGY